MTKRKDNTRICQICQQSFTAKTNQKACLACRPQQQKHYYQATKKERKCLNCNEIFLARGKQTLCEACHKQNRATTMVHQYQEKEIPLLCLECKQQIAIQTVKDTPRTGEYRLSKRRCKDCSRRAKQARQEQRKFARQEAIVKANQERLQGKQASIQDRNKQQRPKRKQLITQCTVCGIAFGSNTRRTTCSLECVSILISRKMSGDNNPMKNPEICKRAHETMKKRGNVFPHGPAHKRWKGNRPFDQVCRTRLYKIWTWPIMQRDGFKCTKCNTTGALQVHHVYPMREILQEAFRYYGLEQAPTTDNMSIYETCLEKVLELHKMEHGITLCKKCHGIVDSYYRRYPVEP